MRAQPVLRTNPGQRLRVGEHVLDVGALRVLTQEGQPRLTPKAMTVLLELAAQPGRTLSRDELLNRVWPRSFPTPDVLTQAIADLRRAFGDDQRTPRYIETIPKLGYRLIAPVANEGTEAAAGGTPAHPAAADESASPPSPPDAGPGMPRRWLLPVVALAVIAAVVALFILFDSRYRTPAADLPRFRISDLRAVTSTPGPEMYPHPSPDGTRVAFSQRDPGTGRMQVVMRALNPSQVIPVGGGAGVEYWPVWSPDGASIAFMRYGGDDCRFIVTSGLGGPERDIRSCYAAVVNAFDWTPDGAGFITSYRASDDDDEIVLGVGSVRGSPASLLKYRHGPGDLDSSAIYSPDGRTLAFLRGGVRADIYLVAASGGAVRRLTRVDARIAGLSWMSDGRGIVFSSDHEGQRALYAVDVGDGYVQALGIAPAEFPAAARKASTVVYQIPRIRTALLEIPLDGNGTAGKPVAVSTGSDQFPAVSPDGKSIVFVSDRSGQQQLWIDDFESNTVWPMTDTDKTTYAPPIWRDDGRAVLVVRATDGISTLIEVDVASNRARVLVGPAASVRSAVYGPEAGTCLIVTGGGEMSALRLLHAGADWKSAPVLARGVERVEYAPAEHAAYYTKSAKFGLFRYDFASGNSRLVDPTITPLHMYGWHLVGNRIWYLTLSLAKPVELREFDPASGADRLLMPLKLDFEMDDQNFSVAPSRDRIYLSNIVTDDTDVGAFTLTRTHPGL